MDEENNNDVNVSTNPTELTDLNEEFERLSFPVDKGRVCLCIGVRDWSVIERYCEAGVCKSKGGEGGVEIEVRQLKGT